MCLINVPSRATPNSAWNAPASNMIDRNVAANSDDPDRSTSMSEWTRPYSNDPITNVVLTRGA